tara:strand:+ start:771 stop:1673 length:903 start_codon:yes stop_codon:yes gene_type:complete
MSFEKSITDLLTLNNLSPSSQKLYIRILFNLNDKKELKNLKFLDKPSLILEKIKDYKPTTQRNIIIAIVSVLKALKSPLYEKYFQIMIDKTKIINDTPTDQKTETQKKNWIEWEEVENKLKELQDNKISKPITEPQYNKLLQELILSLYVMLPPRRNDYINMQITNTNNIKDLTKNYLDLKKELFIFNVFKTSKKDGQLIVTIPDNLMIVIKKYIKYHPNKLNLKKENIPFLVNFKGEPLSSINSITRILNKIFNKNIGSSMLRHIYLSSKYNKVLDEQKQDSKMMSHNLQTQKDYIKKD